MQEPLGKKQPRDEDWVRMSLSYLDQGTGEVIVLLAGIGHSAKHWLNFVPSLAAEGFRVVAPDNPGIGLSSPLPWGASIDDMADEVIKLLDQLGVEKFTVVGLSLGGMIAIALASKNPERVRRLVVINSSVGDYFFPRLQPKAVLDFLTTRGKTERMVKKAQKYLLGCSDEELKKEVVCKWQEIDEAQPVAPRTVYVQTLAAARFFIKKRAKKIVCPCLILFGANDHFVSCRHSFFIHRKIKNSILQSVGDAGHVMTAECPGRVSLLIKQFCAEHS